VGQIDQSTRPWFLLGPDRRPIGPFDAGDMVNALRDGRLSGQQLVARRGDETWRRISEVEEFRGIVSPVPPVLEDERPRPDSSVPMAFLVGASCVIGILAGVVATVAFTGISGGRSGASLGGDARSVSADPVAPRGASRPAPQPAGSPLANEVILARSQNSDNLIWARLGDYSWTDFGAKNFLGIELNGIGRISPFGPDAIAITERYIDAIGVRRVRTIEEANEPFIRDLEAMGASFP
jgi:hypothetical protein